MAEQVGSRLHIGAFRAVWIALVIVAIVSLLGTAAMIHWRFNISLF